MLHCALPKKTSRILDFTTSLLSFTQLIQLILLSAYKQKISGHLILLPLHFVLLPVHLILLPAHLILLPMRFVAIKRGLVTI